MPSIPEYKTSFYAMLPRLGIKMADRSQWDIQAVTSALDEMGDYPLEWFDSLEEEARNRGAENPMRIINMMTTSKAQDREPGTKAKAFTQGTPIRITDAAIDRYISLQVERSLCSHDGPCRAAEYRESLEVTG